MRFQVESYVAAVVEFSPDGVDGAIVPALIYNANLGRYEEFVLQAKQVRKIIKLNAQK